MTPLPNTAVVVIFQIFVNSDVVYDQTWEVLTRKKTPRATLINDAGKFALFQTSLLVFQLFWFDKCNDFFQELIFAVKHT